MGRTELLAGVAGEDITPEIGIHMGGYWGRKSGATGIRDGLKARALAFSCGARRAALVALDLVGLEAFGVALIRRRIEADAGVEGAAVMVCCSHTHAGPLTLNFRGMGRVDPDYMERVYAAAAAAVKRAAAALEPARLAYARAKVQLGINRRQRREGGGTMIGRNPAGPVVPYAHCVRLEGAGGVLATLFSHACHPVVLGKENHDISAEFPGAAAACIEAHTGVPALFVNGACGDINPRVHAGTGEDVEALGGELGRAVLAGLEEAREVEGDGVQYALERVMLPLMDPPAAGPLHLEKLVWQLKAELKKLAAGGGDFWARQVPQARLEWARAMLARARRGAKGQRQPFEIQALRLGGLMLLGLEGEIFARYQLELEPLSPRQPALLCGYANGCIGYVPTADEYARGGYEVEEAYKVYPSVQMIAPQSEALIRARAQELLERVSER